MADETVALPPSEKPTTATPQSSAGTPPVQSIDDVYGDFDTAEGTPPAPRKEAAAQAPKPSTQTKGQPSDTVVSGAEDSQTKTSTDASTKDSSAKDATKDTSTQQPKPVKAAELRSAYENLKREHKTLKAELEQVKAKPANEGEIKQLRELLDGERKARTELEQELKFAAYEKSQEFKDKFHKPYIEAYKQGRKKTASLKIPPKTDDLGEVVTPGRQGTEADFDELMQIVDDDAAAEKATELFGSKAQMVLYYRERVQELQNSSRSAVEEYRQNASTREKEQAEARTRQQEQEAERLKSNADLFKKQVELGKQSRSELFTPEEGDTEAAEIIKHGEAVGDSLFSGINPKTGQPYTPEGLVKFHAFVRNAVAAHGHLLHKLRAAQTRLTELESDLKEFKESGTSADSGRAGEKPAGSGLAGDEEFDQADAKSARRW